MLIKINDANTYIKAIKKDNKLTYKDNKAKMIITYKNKSVILNRKELDHEIEIEFIDNSDIMINYYDISLDITFNIEAFCKKLYKDEHLLIIEYYIKENKENFSLKIEMGD